MIDHIQWGDLMRHWDFNWWLCGKDYTSILGEIVCHIRICCWSWLLRLSLIGSLWDFRNWFKPHLRICTQTCTEFEPSKQERTCTHMAERKHLLPKRTSSHEWMFRFDMLIVQRLSTLSWWFSLEKFEALASLWMPVNRPFLIKQTQLLFSFFFISQNAASSVLMRAVLQFSTAVQWHIFCIAWAQGSWKTGFPRSLW